jgi:hypothetical protein
MIGIEVHTEFVISTNVLNPLTFACSQGCQITAAEY